VRKAESLHMWVLEVGNSYPELFYELL
jgi:hypothetical protein